jgi:hypothetical protein
VRSGQPELVAEEVHKKQPGFDLASDRLIVDSHLHLHG